MISKCLWKNLAPPSKTLTKNTHRLANCKLFVKGHLATMYALDFKQLACDISWNEVALMNQFQYGLRSDVKDLLLTMSNSSTLN
jgi:hypothetical protein